MVKQSILITILFFAFSAIMMSCGDNGQNTKTNSQSNMVEEKIIEQPKVEISGTYSGTDNVGMESTIVLRRGGSMVVKSSIGDGTLSAGEWSGDAENISLYIENEKPYYDNYGNLRMGGNQLLGRGRITQEGLQIIGGKFFDRIN